MPILLNARQFQKQHLDLSLRKKVAKYNDKEFSERKKSDRSVVDLIHRFVTTENISGVPLSLRLLKQKLEEHSHTLLKGQPFRVLYTLKVIIMAAVNDKTLIF